MKSITSAVKYRDANVGLLLVERWIGNSWLYLYSHSLWLMLELMHLQSQHTLRSKQKGTEEKRWMHSGKETGAWSE